MEFVEHAHDRPEPISIATLSRTSQAIGMLLRNQLYARIVDVPEYGIRAMGGDRKPAAH